VDSDARTWGVRCSLALVAVLVTATTANPTAAHPPNSTDHNVSNESFHGLWSKDEDAVGENATTPNGSAREQLAAGTDIPYSSPPQAVARWNRGDHQEFPETNASVSIYPPNATLTDKRFIKDAYAEIFAIQPSTRAGISPNKTPFYVASNGTLRGVVDYRVEVPATNRSGDRRTVWTVTGHSIESTTLFVDGARETRAGGSHTPTLPYSLSEGPNAQHGLLLRATVSAQVEQRTQRCTAQNDLGGCTEWTTKEVKSYSEEATVTASQQVTEHNLTVSGFVARYPNGDLGIVVYKNQPWLGYQVPDGQVRGVWRFYSARDTTWDRLVYNTPGGNRTAHSPLHPLQLNAYPIETGPTASPVRNVTILGAYGKTVAPPTLPDHVRLGRMGEPYTASYGIATRVATSEPFEAVQARGLVRGVRVTQSTDGFARIPIHGSNLTLQVLNQTTETVTVRAHLHDNQTGAAIPTTQRGGWLVIGGQRANTTADGTVTVTIDRPLGSISARYEPGNWWREQVGYTGATATAPLEGSTLALIARLFRLLILIALFLLAVYLIDRITNWHVWPPWRGL
jgi:hypothetical protein